MGHWEQIGTERRRSKPRAESVWTRLATVAAAGMLWIVVLLKLFV